MSSRRVRKGPGRRPMSEKRRQFLELLAQGWSVRGARCVSEVGDLEVVGQHLEERLDGAAKGWHGQIRAAA